MRGKCVSLTISLKIRHQYSMNHENITRLPSMFWFLQLVRQVIVSPETLPLCFWKSVFSYFCGVLCAFAAFFLLLVFSWVAVRLAFQGHRR